MTKLWLGKVGVLSRISKKRGRVSYFWHSLSFLLLLFNIFGQFLFLEFECHCILIEKQIMTDLLASHRRLQLQEFRNQNEEITSFIKSCQGVFLSPKVFWRWAGISYVTSLYSLWCLLQMALLWLKYWLNLIGSETESLYSKAQL